MSEELKPCPFCGSSAHYDEVLDVDDMGWRKGFQCECSNPACCASFGVISGTESQSIKAWNTRHNPTADKLAEALEETIKRPKGVVPDIAVEALKEYRKENVNEI